MVWYFTLSQNHHLVAPMGNGNIPASGSAASFIGHELIDLDGKNHPVNTNLPVNINLKMCYPILVVMIR